MVLGSPRAGVAGAERAPPRSATRWPASSRTAPSRCCTRSTSRSPSGDHAAIRLDVQGPSRRDHRLARRSRAAFTAFLFTVEAPPGLYLGRSNPARLGALALALPGVDLLSSMIVLKRRVHPGMGESPGPGIRPRRGGAVVQETRRERPSGAVVEAARFCHGRGPPYIPWSTCPDHTPSPHGQDHLADKFSHHRALPPKVAS
jgi:hypothetical protein